MGCMRFGGTCRTADAVPSGAPAKQDDRITGIRAGTAHILCRCGGNDGTDLHALGGISGVVQLIHHAGGKPYLVAVGGVASRRRLHDTALGQFSGNRLGYGAGGISRAGHAHGGIHIGAPGQRVTDGSADAGCSTAERLNLSRMVVRFVLEQK